MDKREVRSLVEKALIRDGLMDLDEDYIRKVVYRNTEEYLSKQKSEDIVEEDKVAEDLDSEKCGGSKSYVQDSVVGHLEKWGDTIKDYNKLYDKIAKDYQSLVDDKYPGRTKEPFQLYNAAYIHHSMISDFDAEFSDNESGFALSANIDNLRNANDLDDDDLYNLKVSVKSALSMFERYPRTGNFKDLPDKVEKLLSDLPDDIPAYSDAKEFVKVAKKIEGILPNLETQLKKIPNMIDINMDTDSVLSV